jgi:RNA polymerase sigma factor (sigma-70 family)
VHSALQAIDRPVVVKTATSVDVDLEVRAMTEGVAAGDAEAFARFFDGWFDFVNAEAARLAGRDEPLRLDVVQDAMMRVIRGMKPMDSREHLQGWLRAAVRTAALDLLRREARRIRRERRSGAAPPGEGRDMERAAQLDWLARELTRLDEADSHLLVLRYRFGWTLRRIGVALGATPGAIDGKLRRLLEMLRRRGGEDGRG